MRFAFALPVQYALDEPITQRFEELLELVRAARDAGFDHVGAPQHYLASPFQYLQPVPLLARVAAESGDMTLGTSIMLLALQNPVDVAESIATLDVITGGKFVFGVGLGYRDAEFDAFGVKRGTRLGRFLEALEVVKQLWTEESVTFEGKHFSLQDVSLTTRPVQRPRPPIVIAASNDKMIRRAATIGDAWAIAGHATFQTLEAQVALYASALKEAGKPFPPPYFSQGKELFIAKDMETARRDALPHIATKYAAYAQWGQDEVMPENETFHLPIEELAKDRFIVGDPDYCIEQIELHRSRLHVQQMSFRLHWPGMPHAKVMEAIALFGDRVIRHFKR